MATMKRRVIYATDEQWEAAKRQSDAMGMTISDYLRSLIVGGRVTPPTIADRFNSRPFTPAPKKGK